METKEKPVERQVTYTAGPGDPMAVDWHGMRFVSGVPRPVSDLAMLDQVATNPHFAVDGQDKVKEREAKAADDAKASADEAHATLDREVEEMEARHDAEVTAMEARHVVERGRIDERASRLGPRAKDGPRLSGAPTPAGVDQRARDEAAAKARDAAAIQAKQADVQRAAADAQLKKDSDAAKAAAAKESKP